MKRSELIAKTSKIHDIIYNFNTALTSFKSDVNAKFKEIIEISNNVQWEGAEAKKFKQSVQDSASNISSVLSKTDAIVAKLNAKAAHWNSILSKLNK